MQSAGIFDGDLAIVDRALEAGHNDIVVALLKNELVCKQSAISQPPLFGLLDHAADSATSLPFGASMNSAMINAPMMPRVLASTKLLLNVPVY